MGPRSIERRNLPSEAFGVGGLPASMGPRSIERGNLVSCNRSSFIKPRLPRVRFESREAAQYLSPGREPWARRPSRRVRHPSPAGPPPGGPVLEVQWVLRSGPQGERERGRGRGRGAPTQRFTPWATLCRSFGADLCWDLRLHDTKEISRYVTLSRSSVKDRGDDSQGESRPLVPVLSR